MSENGTFAPGPELKIVWVLHMNCKHGCPHCFLKRPEGHDMSSTDEARILVDSLRSKGYRVGLMLADQSDETALDLYQDVGYTVVDFKDRIPEIEVEVLADSEPRFGFSLHGHTEELQKITCPEPDCFQRTIEALKEAQRLNLPRRFINFTVHKKNYKYLAEFVEFVQQFGVDSLRLIKLMPSPLAVRNMPDLFLDRDEIVEFLLEVKRLRKIYGPEFDIKPMKQSFGPLQTKLKSFGMMSVLGAKKDWNKPFCKCGERELCIHAATKEVFPCRFTTVEPRFRLGYYDEKEGIRLERKWLPPDLLDRIGEPCRSCKLLRWCGGHCRANAILEHMRLTGEFDPYVGYTNCPIALGISMNNLRDEVNAVKSRTIPSLKRWAANILSS